jgi:hypothetical protein
MGETKQFTTGKYTEELIELGKLTDRIDDEELRSLIVESVNRMQAMLRPIVDSYLEQNSDRNSASASMQELLGPGGLG